MPRRRDNGSRGNSPEKSLNSSRSIEGVHPATVQHKMNHDSQGRPYTQYATPKGHVRQFDQNDETCVALQEMFSGKIDPDVVFLVLSECDWKGEKAYETLMNMLKDASHEQVPGHSPPANTAPSHSSQASHLYNPPTSMNERGVNPRPQLQLKSRLPSVTPDNNEEIASLPLLSPRTPMVIDPNYHPLQQNSSSSDIQSAMTALDLYGQNMYLSESVRAYGEPQLQSDYQTSEESQVVGQYSKYLTAGGNENLYGQPGYNQTMIGGNTSFNNMKRPSPQPSPGQYQVSSVNIPHMEPPGLPQHYVDQTPAPPSSNGSTEVVEPEKKARSHYIDSDQSSSSPATKRTSLRKHTVSLDPAERESLEKLIDEVLQQGFSEDFMDSDSSSDTDTDMDEEQLSPNSVKGPLTDKEKAERAKNGKDKKGGKQQSTMKVAAKHMKNIPPRFLRKLQAIQSTVGKTEGVPISADLPVDVEGAKILLKRNAEGEQNKNLMVLSSTETNKPVNNSKTFTGPVNTLPTVTEKGQPQKDISSPPPPLQAYVPSPIIQAPVPLSCEDLERKLLNTAPDQPIQRKSDSDMEERGKNIQVSPNQLVEPSVTPKETFEYIYPEDKKPSFSVTPKETFEYVYPEDKKPSFSVNAPEFVPKAQRPGPVVEPATSSPASAINPSPPSSQPFSGPAVSQPFSLLAGVHAPGGRFSPQTVRLQTASTPERNTPSPGPHYIIPKVPPPSASIASAVPVVPPYQPPPAYPLHQFVHPRAYSSAVYRSPFIATPYPQDPKAQANLVAHFQGAHMYMPQKLPGGIKVPIYPGIRPPLGGLRMPSSPQMQARQDLHNQAQRLRQKLLELIKAGKKVMVILRGLPGSGKSTLARELKLTGQILSTDDYFMRNGKYEYDYSKIGEAHESNQQKAKEAVNEGKNPIVIDNTNTQAWEMKFYINLAKENDYKIEIVEPDSPWKFKPRELARKNTHGVGLDTIQRMLDRYDRQITVERILKTTDKEREEAIQWQKMNMTGDGERKDGKKKKVPTATLR